MARTKTPKLPSGKIPASINAKRKGKTLGGWRLADAKVILRAKI